MLASYIENKVKSVLKGILVQASKNTNLNILQTRIKIHNPDGDGESLRFFVLDGSNAVEETTLKILLNKKIDILGEAGQYGYFLLCALVNLAFQKEVPLKDAELWIYTKSEEGEAMVSLVHKNQSYPLTYQEMISAGSQGVELAN